MVEVETLLVLLLRARCQRSASAWRPDPLDFLLEAVGISSEQLQMKAVRVRACTIGCLSLQGAPDWSN